MLPHCLNMAPALHCSPQLRTRPAGTSVPTASATAKSTRSQPLTQPLPIT